MAGQLDDIKRLLNDNLNTFTAAVASYRSVLKDLTDAKAKIAQLNAIIESWKAVFDQLDLFNGGFLSNDINSQWVLQQIKQAKIDITETVQTWTSNQLTTLDVSIRAYIAQSLTLFVNKAGDTMQDYLTIQKDADAAIGPKLTFANNGTGNATKNVIRSYFRGVLKNVINFTDTGDGGTSTEIYVSSPGVDSTERLVAGLVVKSNSINTAAYGALHDYFASLNYVNSVADTLATKAALASERVYNTTQYASRTYVDNTFPSYTYANANYAGLAYVNGTFPSYTYANANYAGLAYVNGNFALSTYVLGYGGRNPINRLNNGYSLNINYYNPSSSPMLVFVSTSHTADGATCSILVNGNLQATIGGSLAGGFYDSKQIVAIVPSGGYYQVNSPGSVAVNQWWEFY